MWFMRLAMFCGAVIAANSTTTLADVVTAPSKGFWASFASAFLMIVASEIGNKHRLMLLGDKTFLIATIMSMSNARWVIFNGAFMALLLMTIISTLFGALLLSLIQPTWTTWLATILFALFGVRMLVEGWRMAEDEGREEYEHVEHELDERRRQKQPDDLESQTAINKWTVFWECFTLTFVAEWGDRSQLATIIMAASQHWLGVTIGASLGHALCTLMAVMVGRLLSNHLSIRTVTLAGGLLFLLFALLTLRH